MSAVQKPRYTPEEYLARERVAEHKSEYLAGDIFAMAGASLRHNRITFNVSGQLYQQLRGKSCQAFSSEMRVRVSPAGLYTYPDVVAVCGEPQFLDDTADTLLNPTLIIEVLSPSTESYDRGEKFAQYRRLAWLQEYLMITQEQPRLERYTRTPNGLWTLAEANSLTDTLLLDSIGCALPLSAVYERIALDAVNE